MILNIAGITNVRRLDPGTSRDLLSSEYYAIFGRTVSQESCTETIFEQYLLNVDNHHWVLSVLGKRGNRPHVYLFGDDCQCELFDEKTSNAAEVYGYVKLLELFSWFSVSDESKSQAGGVV